MRQRTVAVRWIYKSSVPPGALGRIVLEHTMTQQRNNLSCCVFWPPATGHRPPAAALLVVTAALCALFYSQDKIDFSEKLNTLAGKQQDYKH